MGRSFFSICVLLCLAFAASAQTGTWAGSIEADDFLGAMRLDVQEDSDRSVITLFYAGDKRSGAIEDLKLSDDAITFSGKMQPVARFTGKMAGDRIAGTFEIISRKGTVQGTGVWEVRRVDASLPISAPKVSAGTFTPALIKPTGQFAVGRRLFYWTDHKRDETITDDKNDRRRVFVQLWYPANPNSKGSPAEYFPRLDEFPTTGGGVDVIKNLRITARSNAQVLKRPEKYPLLVFSPGLGSSSFNYSSIIEHMVSNGYVVAAINHAYDSGPFVFSDGTKISFANDKWDRETPKDWTEEERKKFMDERRLEWARDVSFVVDKLQKQRSDVVSATDMANLGAFGHSFGGQAASIVCAADERFKACANLDGLAQGHSFLPDSSGKVMKQPFMFFTKAPEVTNFELQLMGMTRDEYRVREHRRLFTKWKPSYKARMAALESGAYLLVRPGARHSSFGDGPLFDTRSEPPYPQRVADAVAINQYTLAFFDKFLKGKPSPLLDDPNIQDPSVVVEFLKK